MRAVDFRDVALFRNCYDSEATGSKSRNFRSFTFVKNRQGRSKCLSYCFKFSICPTSGVLLMGATARPGHMHCNLKPLYPYVGFTRICDRGLIFISSCYGPRIFKKLPHKPTWITRRRAPVLLRFNYDVQRHTTVQVRQPIGCCLIAFFFADTLRYAVTLTFETVNLTCDPLNLDISSVSDVTYMVKLCNKIWAKSNNPRRF